MRVGNSFNIFFKQSFKILNFISSFKFPKLIEILMRTLTNEKFRFWNRIKVNSVMHIEKYDFGKWKKIPCVICANLIHETFICTISISELNFCAQQFMVFRRQKLKL